MSSGNHHGRITSGVPADTAVNQTLGFIERNLAPWRDDPERPAAVWERDLNSQLCKFLNWAARRSDFAMVHFHHEEPQGVRHSADISATPVGEGWIEGRPYSKYDPILIVEGKRLPTPGSGREREYVTSAIDAAPSGGVQRFKLGLHGAALSIAGIVGYVQAGTCAEWYDRINAWIDDLASSPDPLWSGSDRLDGFMGDGLARVSRCESEHSRPTGVSPTIRLAHLWVEM